MFVETAYIPLQCLEILQQTLPYITQGNTAKLHRFSYHFESKIPDTRYQITMKTLCCSVKAIVHKNVEKQ
jgi:hypothetical protein